MYWSACKSVYDSPILTDSMFTLKSTSLIVLDTNRLTKQDYTQLKYTIKAWIVLY